MIVGQTVYNTYGLAIVKIAQLWLSINGTGAAM